MPQVMTVETRAEALRTLMNAQGELQALTRTTESGIESVARAFQGLASQADTILDLAAVVVRCVENESVSAVMPNVQTLGAAAMRFIGDRLQVTSGVLEMVTQEVDLLKGLSRVTRGQMAIALETRALSLLTNIEVSRLGAAGASFQYLAQELAGFSKSVTQDTLELTNHTDVRRAAMEETQRTLTTELPRQRQEMTRIQAELGNAFAAMDSSLTQLFRTPTQFRTCVEEVAQKITGVVAAVQAHDITRQQMNHVEEALELVSAGLREAVSGKDDFTPELAAAYAGLTIQTYQLRAVKDTVARWISQIRTCMDDILRVSASEVVAIGPLVREHEDKLSFQLTHIEKLQRESQAYGARIRRSLEGLSHLMQLVNQHLQRSNSVQGHLQLLTFNSIIEASRLGAQAAAMLAIAESLKDVSAEWTHITHQSELTRDKVENLARQTNDVMGAFTETVDNKLSEAQAQTQAGVDSLRSAAVFAARQAQEMKVATEKMQAQTSQVVHAVDLLDASFDRLSAVLAEIEGLRRRLDGDHPEVKQGYDTAEVEKLFSASYTTEMEREILRAALNGTALPAGQASFAGNSVELF
jgi:hypothetical protein